MCLKRLFIPFLLSLAFFSPGYGQELLKLSDIRPVMQQILQQHVDQKEMSAKTMKGALKVYIDRFDPERIYLLQQEVLPYLEINEEDLNAMLIDYKENRYPNFQKLNSTIQTAIQRARQIRKDLGKSPAIFTLSRGHFYEDQDPDLKRQFPNNEPELKENIKKYLGRFIQIEKKHFGEDVVMANQPETLLIFERGMQEKENAYLFLDYEGKALSEAEQENLFALNILKAMASALDAHTTVYNQNEATELRTRLQKEFQGVGIIFQQNIVGAAVVTDISEGGPAAKSGMVQIGDTLLEVNGKKVNGLPFERVMEMVRRGDAGQNNDIQLTLQRKDKGPIVKVQLKKQDIALQAERAQVAFRPLGDGVIGLITLNSFYQNPSGITSENDVKKALEQLKEKGHLQGLILDLRENSGGFLNQAIRVAGLFISNGVIVVSKYFNGAEHYYRDLDGKSYYEGPLIILTSRATASAAEIVAQALQDYGVALIVGDESTYGKGTIQNQNVTGKGNKNLSLFKVTVGKYYTVSGHTPQLKGVKADILVPGIFNEEHLGEQYLEFTVQNDTIPSEYADDLEDVSPNLKAWYQRYYLPSLQHKKQIWQKMLPFLRERSRERIAQNAEYQSFLQQARTGHPVSYFTKDQKGKSKKLDFQVEEAVNILQDMIKLEKQERSKTLSEPMLIEGNAS